MSQITQAPDQPRETPGRSGEPRPESRPESPPPAPGRAGEAPGRPAPAPRKTRDPLLDNVKFLAIILVVAGHLIEDLRDQPVARAIYLFIYSFHMPVFIIVAGYLSRGWSFSGGKARKLITNIAVPYAIFETAYSVFSRVVGGANTKITLLDPHFLTWFLISLFAWRLSTPVWQQLRWPLPIAVIIAILSGMNELARELDMNRILGLLPFYVLGLTLRREHFELLKRPIARIAGWVVLAGAFGAVALFHKRLDGEWVYWRHGNAHLDVSDLKGSAIRLALYVGATVLAAAFIAVVPRRQTWFTPLGAATLYAYLLHGFLMKFLEYRDWTQAAMLDTVPGVLAMMVVGFIVSTVLCTEPVRKLFGWAVEPKMRWAFTRLRRY
ncbi:acyltransferase family protein [Bailinhaonella thermotolerans]|uniref:Acyltransferase n=1 Tax=Bailinhaonella thermotolerans TaxID=1070861 RepID=A0A3A4A465_9ACTN|nr:acyltransferase family protein [Bailinhaonella thermotolerans]RJL22484.1 acyltransferase [Bailinhaonella thermotolerans]